MARLAAAYRTGNIEDVISLYNVESRAKIRERLSLPDLRERWLSGVTSIQSLKPLIIWEQGKGFSCVLETTLSKNPNTGKRTLMMLRFDSDFNLVVDDVSSPVTEDLFAYLSDKSRNPGDLVVGDAGKADTKSIPQR